MKSMRYAKWWKVVESGGTSPGKAMEWWPPLYKATTPTTRSIGH